MMAIRCWGLLMVLIAIFLWVCPARATEGSAKKVAPASGTSLMAAYKREFAFLQSEKTSLAQRLETQRLESSNKIAAAEADLSSLQGRVLATSVEADRLAALLHDEADRAETAAEGNEILETLLSQATATLEKGALRIPEGIPEGKPDGEGEEVRAEQAKAVFDQALGLLDRYASVRTLPGAFFLEDGKQVEGQLFYVGNIATYGVSEASAGVLAPAGQDRLKIWPGNNSEALARSLVSNESPPTLGIFLYESLEKGIEVRAKQTVFEHVASGGIIAWVIVGLGLLGLLMVAARAIILGLSGARIEKILACLTPLVARKDLAQACRICESSRGAAARVLRVALLHLDQPRERLEDAVSEALLHEQTRLERFGAMILVVAAVAPLLGLLGTVTGMISTFDVITEFGTGDPKMLSGGISEALVTTELGLIVAIPILLSGNVLTSWAGSIRDSLEKAALRVVNITTGVQVDPDPELATQQESPAENELPSEQTQPEPKVVAEDLATATS